MHERIDVTVAAVIEHDARFLVVEEDSRGRIVFNQPAGHLEPGESLVEAAVRETLEETGYGFSPSDLVGIYLWHGDGARRSFLRVNFCGPATSPPTPCRLDEGIIATHWMSRAQLAQRGSQLRSPMVLRAIDDYFSGARFPLDCLSDIERELRPRAQSA